MMKKDNKEHSKKKTTISWMEKCSEIEANSEAYNKHNS